MCDMLDSKCKFWEKIKTGHWGWGHGIEGQQSPWDSPQGSGQVPGCLAGKDYLDESDAVSLGFS